MMTIDSGYEARTELGRAQGYGSQSMIGRLRRVMVRVPGDEYTEANWQAMGLEGQPDHSRAVAQQRRFIEILEGEGVEIEYLQEGATVHSTAVYDPALITEHGAIILPSSRPARRAEATPMARALLALEIPILGTLHGHAAADGGDTLWLDRETLLVGHGFRTNDAAFLQLRALLDGIATVEQIELPYWRGTAEVLHLMSMISLVDRQTALVYPRNAPLRAIRALQDREYSFVEVPDEEWETLGSNALCLGPGKALITSGNPVTAGRLRDAGIEVLEFEADEICWRRVSGPTCNTRPLLRDGA